MNMKRLTKSFIISERGATAIEYGMIAGLVFLAIVGAVSAVGSSVSSLLYDKIQAAL